MLEDQANEVSPKLKKRVLGGKYNLYDPDVHYQREPSFKDDTKRSIYAENMNPAKISVIKDLLQNPVSKRDGDRTRKYVLSIAGFETNPIKTNLDLLKLLTITFSYYDTHLFKSVLVSEGDSVRIAPTDDEPLAMMWYSRSPILKLGTAIKNVFRKEKLPFAFVHSGKIEFYDIKKLYDQYDFLMRSMDIYEKKPNIYAWENFNHFALYVCEHELTHALLANTRDNRLQKNSHDKLFWTLLQSFTGQSFALIIASGTEGSFFASNDTLKKFNLEEMNELIYKMEEQHFLSIRNSLKDKGMANSKDVEDVSKAVFQTLIAMYS